MSQRLRDLPNKLSNLIGVASLCHHHHQSKNNRRATTIAATDIQSKYFEAVKLLFKMAILILANHRDFSQATTTNFNNPSSQQIQNKLINDYNRQAAAPSIVGSVGKNAPSLSTLSELNSFEWPRLSGNNQHKSINIFRNSSSTVRIDKDDVKRLQHMQQFRLNNLSDSRGLNIQRSIDRKANEQIITSSFKINHRPTIGYDDASNDLHTQTALVRLSTNKDFEEDENEHTSDLPNKIGEVIKSRIDSATLDTRFNVSRLSDGGSVLTLPATNKSSRSIQDKVYLERRLDQIEARNSLLTSLPYSTDQVVDTAESNQIEHNPECALILKRTYILKHGAGTNPDEWGDKFVFNDVDPHDLDEQNESKRKRKIHKADLCIKHSDVDKALEEAKHRIKFEKPADLESFEVGERSLASIGELNLAAGLLLTKRFDLSHDEIMNALPMIDMSTSKVYWKDLCPKHVRPMVCVKSRYRTITAHCNNLKHPSWGASKTPYSRYLPPDYADGLSAPRASRSGEPLPSARLISSVVHQDSDEPSHDYSVLFADWGQLLNHDITRVAVGEAPDCCPQLLKGLCMPIPVPQNDPLYSKFNVKCLKFERSLAAIRPKCLLGHRAQINLITSPVDASFVYGSTKQQAQRLRALTGGKMKVANFFEKYKLKPLLPPKTEEPDKDCVARPKNLFCFEAGDVRVNEQTHLTVLHTIYLREHNRIAKQLAKINMEWDDDKLYHETRHIVAACVQHVMVNEFLPLLLGNQHVNEYKIKPSSDGHWNGYDSSVTISTGTAFASAAFRYGHSMIEGVIRRLDPKSGAHIKSEMLRHLFKRPFWLYEPGAVDQLVAGMLLTPAEQTDPAVSEELSGHLFQPPKAKFGHDLAAINIQRGRDQGVPGYNEWREWCGLKRAKSFDDLEPLLMHHTAMQYSKLYKHVDDIDLWSAGISERKLPGSAVGPTLACIIARQFLNYKRGDRFWYENPGQPSSFTPNQLREIKKITLAKILCTNADDLPRIQPWAMRLPHPIYNSKVPCESLPTINLKHWDSSLIDSLDR